MRVRVYAPDLDSCFCSELYALLYTGVFQRCLVVREGLLRLYHQTLPDEAGEYCNQVGFIDPDFPAEWICLQNGDLPRRYPFPQCRPEDPKGAAFYGYPWVWADQRTLLRLLNGEAVPLTETAYPPVCSQLPGWRYVTTPEEAEALLHAAHGFHDTVLVSLHYVSGSERTKEGMLCSDRARQVTMLFHCDWTPPIELVFEGVKALNLRPAGTNGCSILTEATCRVRDAMVFFSAGWCEEGEEGTFPGTAVWAYSLRWRFLSDRS